MYLNEILNVIFNKYTNKKKMIINKSSFNIYKKYLKQYNINNNTPIGVPAPVLGPVTNKNKILNVELLFKLNNVQPIKYWINLENKNNKEDIKNYLYKKQGIYYIGNIITNEFYIGSAGFNNLYKRFLKHLYTLEGNTSIAKDVKRYGLNTFVYGILEIYDDLTLDRDYLFNIEQIYLYNKLPTYNNDNLKAVFLNKLIKLNEVKDKIQFAKDNDIFGIYLNKYLNIDRLQFNKIYLKYNNMYYNNDKIYKKWSLKGIISIIKGLSLPLYLYNINNELICSFESRKVAAHLLGCNDRTIIRAIKESGYIYIPNQFIPYLKNHFDINSKPIINNFKTYDLEYISCRNKIHIVKATRYSLFNTTKVFIKDNVQK